ncbi:RNA polymerase factor sigma-54 [Amaricoccus sp.]|uniref:RNA polymerase factor sigma-54 n=1 Tax=Amaricoccus sp. TaxID=1872485 RepID=UPI001B55B512|nr:RNA polymerase factor sigma-54 [Amaricoccus sp.]MBP7242870.1 RNA polymerase factor sigma-54 [Amaricoccus sp.]
MALAPRIEIRQGQTLVMTPQLQQAIRLLQLSNLALSEYVAAEVEKNPFLELAPPPPATPTRTSLGPRAGGGSLDALDTTPAFVGLAEHLLAQIGAVRAAAPVVTAARLLAEELEEDGYLRVPLAEVAARHRLAPADAERGLALVQSCDPVGVGARTLAECMSLQLRDKDRFDPAMRTLVENLALLARGRTAELQALCGVDAADFAGMLAELRALDPKPGLRFAETPTQAIAPDVYVERAPGGGWTVELNTETLPRVLVNNRYVTRLAGKDGATRAYVSEMSAAANWLVRSLQQRARTILKVASELARHQDAFFDAGPSRLRPLTQRALANRIGLHESTVSRVTADKYVACERGVFEMRGLFSATIQSSLGGEGVSAAAVQSRIRTMIGDEGPTRPHSDDRLVALLAEEGIEIARRTVAKYREGMGIPSSVERRRARAALART